MKMFSRYQDDKTREWNAAIQRYIALHKYLKEVGKTSISQARTGPVNTEVQLKLADALRQTDKALSQLKDFFKPCLTTIDVTDIYPQEELQVNAEELNQEISKLKHENDSLRQELSKHCGTDAGIEIKNLQQELELNHQNFERNRENFLKEKYYLEQKVSQFTEEIQYFRNKYQSLLGLDENSIEELKKNGNFQVTHLKRQQELEETLKTQNNLIYNLKQQLLECERDREIFKSLNRTLEMELKRTQLLDYPKKKITEQNGNDYTEDYFNRSTLKIGEYNSQPDSWKYEQNFVPFFPLENDIEKRYAPKFKSLQEIPVLHVEEKIYMKSKSYDYELDDHSFTLVDFNLHQKQQELEHEKENEEEKGRDVQSSSDPLEKSTQDEKMMENHD